MLDYEPKETKETDALDSLPFETLEALAREVGGHLEVQNLVQNNDGGWYWSDYYPKPYPQGHGVWYKPRDGKYTRCRVRIVSDWYKVEQPKSDNEINS